MKNRKNFLSRYMPIAQYIAPFKSKVVGSPTPVCLINFKDKIWPMPLYQKKTNTHNA